MKERYYVDERVGCAAIIDRLHPNFDEDRQGLDFECEYIVDTHFGTWDNVERKWTVDKLEIERLHKRCDELNKKL